MSKKKSAFTEIEIDGTTYLLDARGALHFDGGTDDKNNRVSDGVVVNAKEIERIGAFSEHMRTAPELPGATASGYDLESAEGYEPGSVQVGCTVIEPADIARVVKASRKMRGRK